MLDITVAYNYAEAIFNSNFNNDTIFEYFTLIEDVFNKNPLFTDLLSSAYISSEEKRKMFFKVFPEEEKYSKLFNVIFDNNKEEYIFLIIRTFISLYKKKKGIGSFFVVSSVKLDDKCVEKLKNILMSKFKLSDICFTFKVDTSIISGLLIYYDDMVLDLSVSGFLNRLKAKLLNS